MCYALLGSGCRGGGRRAAAPSSSGSEQNTFPSLFFVWLGIGRRFQQGKDPRAEARAQSPAIHEPAQSAAGFLGFPLVYIRQREVPPDLFGFGYTY